jgi:uncharacterized protein (DUF433 family)
MSGVSNGNIGIEAVPNICGGDPCINQTRIPVWLLVRARQLGASDHGLFRCYPALRAEDLSYAWAYYRLHQADIEQQILDNENA